MIEIKNYEKSDLSEVQRLAMEEYEEESKRINGMLPEFLKSEWLHLISYITKKQHAKVALEDGKLVGYLMFDQPWQGALGNVKGVYSPLGCSAFLGSDRSKTASYLFEEVSKELVKEEVCGYAISRYAHEENAGRALIMSGFGIRCSDAIMNIKDMEPLATLNEAYTFLELKGKERRRIHRLNQGLVRHLADGPIYFPTDLKRFSHWYDNENKRVFAVKEQEEYIGYMAIEDDAETFVTEESKMVSICGMYVDRKYRGKGIAKQLLEYVRTVCVEEEFEYLGVDCETLNPTALRFWGKYFTNYTYSYHRRIDERCVGYVEYLKKEWGEENASLL